jgi:hypothetical protein
MRIQSTSSCVLAVMITRAVLAPTHGTAVVGHSVTTSSITIVDKNGKERAFLGLRAEDQPPILVMRDSSGRERLRIDLQDPEGAPSIFMNDDKEHGGVWITMHPHDGPLLSFGKEGHMGLVNLRVASEDGQQFGRISLSDDADHYRFVKPDDHKRFTK